MHANSKGGRGAGSRCKPPTAAFAPPTRDALVFNSLESQSQAAPAHPGGGCSWLYTPTIMTAAGDASAGLRYPEPLATEVNTRAVVALGPQLRQRGVLASTLRRPGVLRRARQELLLSFIDEDDAAWLTQVADDIARRGAAYLNECWRREHIQLPQLPRDHAARRLVGGGQQRRRRGALPRLPHLWSPGLPRGVCVSRCRVVCCLSLIVV